MKKLYKKNIALFLLCEVINGLSILFSRNKNIHTVVNLTFKQKYIKSLTKTALNLHKIFLIFHPSPLHKDRYDYFYFDHSLKHQRKQILYHLGRDV